MRSYPGPGVLFVFLIAAILICTSCQKKTPAPEPSAPRETYTDKCHIDISSTTVIPDCSLSKQYDERAVWENKSTGGLYVCMNPLNNPFEAYAWYVPANDKRKSGKITDATNPSSTGYEFKPSPSPCVWPLSSASDKRLTNPKIIIGQ